MTDEERTRLAEALASLKAALDDLPEMSFAVDLAILDLERLRDGLTITGHAPEVARLDRSRPPPGYHVDEQDDGWWWWVAEPEDGNMEPCDSEADAVAAAWTHHEARHDPPGLEVVCWPHEKASDPPTAFTFNWLERDLGARWHVKLTPWFEGADGQAQAGAAAWTWYWRRVAFCDPWPECLTWSDEQVAEVERWLAEGGDLPEVLRAG